MICLKMRNQVAQAAKKLMRNQLSLASTIWFSILHMAPSRSRNMLIVISWSSPQSTHS